MPLKLSKKKEFYDKHQNFTDRTLIDYNISPGTMAKFDIIKERIGNKRHFHIGLDVGCSGNSFIHFLNKVDHRVFLDLAHKPLIPYSKYTRYHPSEGSLTQIPFKDNSFDLVVGLDVIEHIYDDGIAASELIRVLQPNGIIVISVPHRMKFYSYQDVLIGHYRRYELDQLRELFISRGLEEITFFGVYGQAMRVQLYQAANPEKMETDLKNLRKKYISDIGFRRIYDKLVKFGSKLMKIDAKFQPLRNIMNICIVFRKPQ